MHNRRQFLRTAFLASGALALPSLIIGSANAAAPTLKLAISIYAGWMPWYLAHKRGIIAKWAKKYGINIEVKYFGYVPSIEAYQAGQADAVVITNMDALTMPVGAGIDSTAIIMGDYSNGNDAILVRNGLQLADLKGKEVRLVEKTVSTYLLARALGTVGLTDKQLKIVNVSDDDIQPQFIADRSQVAAVTWNPMVLGILQQPGVRSIWDSSKIPGEIQDLCVVNSKVLTSTPAFARALTGAWYEVLGIMSGRGTTADTAIAEMGAIAKDLPSVDAAATAEFKKQLTTTAMYYTPIAALAFTRSRELQTKNALVLDFCASHNLLSETSTSPDVVGIVYPDGTVQGGKSAPSLRYVDTFMAEAEAGKL